MTALDDAKTLFFEAGLPFPAIPEALAERLAERSRWCFATEPLELTPYLFEDYVAEGARRPVADYAVLAHAGHGINSYAIHYYLVYGRLRLFLQVGWGGVYMDADAAAVRMRDCFALAAQLVPAAHASRRIPPGSWLTIAASEFYGIRWGIAGDLPRKRDSGHDVAAALAEVLRWLATDP